MENQTMTLILDGVYPYLMFYLAFTVVFAPMLNKVQEKLLGSQKPWNDWGTRLLIAPLMFIISLFLALYSFAIAYDVSATILGYAFSILVACTLVVLGTWLAWGLVTQSGYVSNCKCKPASNS
jgi:hypothetical protein